MTYRLDQSQCRNLEISTRREWVLPNGIGGYAMGTVSGINTRRYHGHFIASTHPPTGRMLLLGGVDATASFGGTRLPLSSNQYPGVVYPDGFAYLKSFEATDRTVTWHYAQGTVSIEKQLEVEAGRNAVKIRYTNKGKKAVELALRPLVCHRDHHGDFAERSGYPQSIEFGEDVTIVSEGETSIVFGHSGAKRIPVHGWYYRFEHARESDRGLHPRDDLYCPCEFKVDLQAGQTFTLLVSDQEGDSEVDSAEAFSTNAVSLKAALESAAGKFVVETNRRSSILAGYPWFTDWGRDTMISLPGILLVSGRFQTARELLSAYASQLRRGLIPNRFVERGEEPDYNTVDATLWFGNAIYRTLSAEWDETFARKMYATLQEVVQWHRKGTDFGIHVDPSDGLLCQGEHGVQLTWMDAKIGDWVVTPRHGKPVEINALWINLLRVIEWIGGRIGEDTTDVVKLAELGEKNFEAKFWHPIRGHYLDTCEPNDASLRPNQVLAMSLPFSPVDPEHARRALEVVRQELLTPVGLRTLGPKEPGYKGRFEGPLPELDAAYHQGTVWPWLLGSFVTSLVKFTGDVAEGRRILKEAREMLSECGIGGISEVYDGDAPHRPNGCPWQAWSVAEIRRAWVEDLDGD